MVHASRDVLFPLGEVELEEASQLLTHLWVLSPDLAGHITERPWC